MAAVPPMSRDFNSLSEALQAGNYVEQLISAEHHWISNRLAWLFTSQTFCIMAYTILITSNNHRFDDLDTTTLRYGLPSFGILACLCVGLSVMAAGRVVRRLADVRARVDIYVNDHSPLQLPLIGADRHLRSPEIRWTYVAGALPRYVLPWALASLWLTLLVG